MNDFETLNFANRLKGRGETDIKTQLATTGETQSEKGKVISTSFKQNEEPERKAISWRRKPNRWKGILKSANVYCCQSKTSLKKCI